MLHKHCKCLQILNNYFKTLNPLVRYYLTKNVNMETNLIYEIVFTNNDETFNFSTKFRIKYVNNVCVFCFHLNFNFAFIFRNKKNVISV